MAKSGGFSSFDYTYGVGLEFKADSAKQIKNELKVNLDSLSKMIKSYEKVLKIDPDADLSKLFSEMRKLKGLVDGINNSDNSFATFVDKGLLSRISTLENSLRSVSATSEKVEANLSGLRSDIDAITSSLKEAGQIKFPATFDNLFGDIKNQATEIKQVTDQIKLIENALKTLQNSRAAFKKSFSLEFDGNLDDMTQFSKWLKDFDELKEKLQKTKGLPLNELAKDILKLSNLGQKINMFAGSMPEDAFDQLDKLTGQNLNKFNSDFNFVTNQIDELIKQIDVQKAKLSSKLDELQSVQNKYNSKQGLQTSSGKSLGIQSDYNAQVKVTPKTNDAEWATKINDTIKNIEPQLNPVKLKPTFSNSSKNIEKEIEGNLAQINHAINVDLQVTDNIEQFNQRIQNIDKSIKNAKAQLEENGNFKLKFEYEEGGNFKDAAYKIINQLKHVEVHVDSANTKAFLKEITTLKDEATKILKKIPAQVILEDKKVLTDVGDLRTKIDEKIGNIGVNLTLLNIPQFMAQAALMRDSIEAYYDKNPIGAAMQPGDLSGGVQQPVQDVVELSDKAKKAQETIEKIKSAIKSLTEQGFKSPEFLKLGMFDESLNPIAKSKDELEKFLNLYNKLYQKLNVSKEKLRETYGATNEGYAAYAEDSELLQQAENALNEVLQRQLAYSQKRLDAAQQILETEMKLSAEKQKQNKAESKSVTNSQSEVKLAMSKEQASAKQKELQKTISQQQAILKDLEKKGYKSQYFSKLGNWDKQSSSFKKNSKEIQDLISKYEALKKARLNAGGKKAVGEEASLRGKLGAILTSQKKHIEEIVAQNKKELESVKQVTAAYKEKDGGAKKSKKTKLDIDIDDSAKKIKSLTEKLEKAKAAVDSLTKGKRNKISAARYTGLGDVNNRLDSQNKKQDYFEVLKLYDRLEKEQNTLRKSGQGQSDTYKQNAQILKDLRKQLKLVYDDQLKYSKIRVSQLEEEIAKETEKRKAMMDQRKELKKQNKQSKEPVENQNQPKEKGTKPAPKSSHSNAPQPNAPVVTLDAATLGSLAKDDTLKSIDGKINNILSQFNQGIKISGASVAIEASGVSISDNASGDSVVLNNPNVNISDASGKIANITNDGNISLLLEQLNEFVSANHPTDPNYKRVNTTVTTNRDGSVSGAQITYATKDGLNAITEYYKLVTTDAKTKTKQFMHVSTTVQENIKAYEAKIASATKKQNDLISSSNKSVLSLEGSLDPNAKKTLAGSEYATQVAAEIQKIREEVAKLDSYTDGQRVLFSEEGLSNQKRIIDEMVAQTQALISQSKNALYPDVTSGNKEVNVTTISSYSRQLVAFEEQAKRSGIYTDELKAKITALNKQLNAVKVQDDLDTYKFDLDRIKEEIEQLKTYDKLYKDFIKSQSKQIQLNDKIATSSDSTTELQQQLRIEEKNSRNIEAQLSKYSELYTVRARQLAIEEAIKNANQEIAKELSAQADKASDAQNKALENIVRSSQNKYNKMLYAKNNSPMPMSGASLDKLKEYESLLTKLRALKPGDANYAQDLENLTFQMDKVQKGFDILNKASSEFFSKIKSSEDIKPMGDAFDPNDLTQMHNAMREFANQVGPCEDRLTKFNDAERTATFVIKNGQGQIQQLTVAYDEATNAIGRYVSKTQPAISQSQKLFNSIKHAFGNVTRYLVSFGSVYELFAIIRQGVQYVRDIDLALTELKKVTNETDETYNAFLQNMSKTGSVIGATVSDLTRMAAEWARLGYSIEESGKLAESTAILLNVSEFSDATKASEALISTMQAFGYAADESQHVVDILNEVGNNYAISSDGIATALQDSASALMEGGNNLEQATALVASANRVVQDPNSVGSALRTISLRLRGTSVEILEKMGEETDGAVESISKMQSKIKALTGVDIVDMNGAYKDTYTILHEIGQVWEDMNDMDQAALLELMAGKNRANTLAAILGNMEDLEGAYESAMNAEGSAMRENAAYLDSIQGRIDLFTNALQTMWMNLISSDVVKGVVDIGTALIKFLDTGIGKITVLLGLFKGFSLHGQFKASGQESFLDFLLGGAKEGLGKVKDLSGISKIANTFKTAFYEELSNRGETNAFDLLAALGGFDDAANILPDLVEAFGGADINLGEKILNKKQVSEILDSFDDIDDATKTAILNSGLFATAQTGAAGATNVLSASAAGLTTILNGLKASFMSLWAAHPTLVVFAGVALAITAIAAAYEKWGPTHENAIKKLEKETEELQSVQDELKSVNSELESIQDSMNKLESKDKLTFVEEQELDRLRAVSAELERQKAILEAKESREKAQQIKAAVDAAEKDANLQGGANDAPVYAAISEKTGLVDHSKFNRFDANLNALERAKEQLAEAEAKLMEADNDDTISHAPLRYKALQKDVEDARAAVERCNSALDTMGSDWQTNYGEVGFITKDDGEELTAVEEKWNDIYRAYHDAMDRQSLLNNDITKADVLERVFGKTGTEAAQAFKKEFAAALRIGTDPAAIIQNALTNEDYADTFNNIEKMFGISVQDVIDYFTKIGSISSDNIIETKTVASVSASVDSYNEALKQTQEILTNGTTVTQEYKDALISLVGSEEKVNECFVDGNSLVVKNADGLDDLLKASKKNIASQAKLAKTQAKLKYYDLYKQINKLTGGKKVENAATLAQVNALYAEMTALQKSIAKYSMLEHKLLGAANAYEEFANAQEIDGANDYETKAEDMVSHLVDAFHTAKLGTESAQAAIKGLVPESVYEDLDTLDDKMQAVYGYFTKDLAQYFTVKFNDDGSIESAEMKLENIKEFVEDGIDNGVFTGSWEEWDLDPTITSLDKLAEKMNVTKEVAFAFLQAMETYDISWLGGDASTLLDKLTPTSDTIKEFGEQMQKEFDQTPIDLTARVKVSAEKMAAAGYTEFEGGQAGDYATVYSQTFTAGEFGLDGDFAVNLTPILPDGTVIDGGSNGLVEWVNKQIKQGKKLEELDVFLGSYKTIEEAEAAGARLSELQADYYEMLGNYSLENEIHKTTSNIAEIGIKIAEGSATEEEVEQYTELSSKLDQLKDQAKDKSVSYIEISENLSEAKNKMLEYSDALEEARDQGDKWKGETIDGVEYTAENIEELEEKTKESVEEVEDLSKELKKIGDVTEYELQIGLEQAKEDVDDYIKSCQEDEVVMNVITQLQTKGIDGLDGLKDENGNWSKDLVLKAYPELKDDEGQLEKIMGLLPLLEKQYKISMQLGENTPTVEATLQSISDTLTDIKNILAIAYNVNLDTSTAEANVLSLKGIVQGLIDLWNSNPIGAGQAASTTTGTPVYAPGLVDGTAHAYGNAYQDGSWGAPKTEDALVGELGPEIIVRNGRWFTVGDNGAEFTKVRRGDIIFNHQQSKSLLSHGYVTGRGKMKGGNHAFAGGTAYAGSVHPWTGGINIKNDWQNVSSSLSNAAGAVEDAAEKFEEVFDWVEVRLEEINETLDLMNANLENAVGYGAKNEIIDQMIDTNKVLLANTQAGAEEYKRYTDALLQKVPEKYREPAQNGAIAVEEFAGEENEKTLEAINNYREWAQKYAELIQQMEEIETEIASLAKQKFDNVSDQYENELSLIERTNDQLDAQVSLMEDRGYVAAAEYYESMIQNTQQYSEQLELEKQALQNVLDEQVKLGNIKKYSDEWYEMVDAIYEVDASINDCTASLEEYQNAINDIYWDNFDELINRYDYLADETQNLIDLMENAEEAVADPEKRKYEGGTVEFWTADDVKWTEEGIASLGLYAQQMEIAEKKAEEYAIAIEDLNEDYKAGKYSETEYLEKLNELKDAQYESIDAYYEAQDAIKDLNEARIDSIKEGIEKEVEAYEELIDKKKEALDAEKDLYDFQKSVNEQQKDIAKIERQLAALQYDDSLSAIAKRKQLEAELAEANAELEETYYDRSIEDQKNALDKELEDFQEEKDAEIEKWEEYLDNIEQIVADSLTIVQANASGIYDTLSSKAEEYDLTLSEAILTPWQDGALAISDYQETFDTAASSTMDQLDAIKDKWQELIDKMSEAAGQEIAQQKQENATITAATKSEAKTSASTGAHDSTYTVKSGDTLWDIATAQLGSGARWQEIYNLNRDIISNPDLIQPGWKLKLPKYAKGTTGVNGNQLAIIDELGLEELVMHADGNGRLAFLSKGSAVIPHDISENLMALGQLDPQDILDRNRPVISAPHVTNNNIELTMEIAEVVHIDTVTNDTVPNLAKTVEKQIDKYMKGLNSEIRKFTR